MRRRPFLRVCSGAAGAYLGGSLAGCLSLRASSGDLGQVDGSWAMVGRDPGHTGSVEAGPADPIPAWTTDLTRARAAVTPALADGRLYVPVDAVSDEARHRHRLHALEAATGEERWQVPLRSEQNTPPAVSDPYVVVSARRDLEEGRVVAFTTRHGDEHWIYDIDARVTAPPTVQGGTAYVPDWRGRIHALTVSDGSVRWSRRILRGETRGTIATPVAVHDGTVYLGSRSGWTGVVAVRARSGDEIWRRSTDAVTGGPVVGDDLLVVRMHHLVAGFDLDGTRRWTLNVLDARSSPVAVADGHAYVPAGDVLYAIDRTGEEVWTYEPPEGLVGTPTVVGESVFVRARDRLVGLSRGDGREQWATTHAGGGRAVVTPGAVFLTGDGERVRALGGG